MHSTRPVLSFCVAVTALLLGTSNLLAQQITSSETGLIGRRYAGFDFTYNHYENSVIGYTFGTDAVFNQPLNRKLDLTLGYDLAHTSGSDHSLNHNALQASVFTHEWTEYGTAYFGGTLGHRWERFKNFGVLTRDDDAFWALTTGYEIPMGRATALNLGLTYRNVFRGSQTTLQYRVEANHWLASTFAVVASASYNQVSKASNTLLYTVGVRWALR